ncbi:MAG: glycerophosphodiester phosphodiesterase family protein [Bacteroides sp.]|nr:glycerophosphodiester phosphodiesterase family protein [Bacteroidales bacterium]MBD5340632.1 glycerophosphodiester phosphodiesterase family protein [Bacteroides sp.]
MLRKSLSALAMLIVCISAWADNAPCRVDTLLGYMSDKGKSDHVMIFAHRGNWRNSAENSVQAYQECIDEKIDGIEIDVQMTKDSVLVIMHDDTVDRTTTGKGKVSDLTLAEIKALNLVSPIGVVTRQKVPTLEEVFKLAKGKILMQVDKWRPYAKEIIELARKNDCERQIIIRTTEKREAMDRKFGDLFKNVVLMPVLVCKGEPDNDKLDDFMSNYNCPVIALSFTKDNFPVLSRIPEIQDAGYRVWINSLWGSHNGNHDDELALTDYENSYGWLLNRGANIIFSDNPMWLKKYLMKVGRW